MHLAHAGHPIVGDDKYGDFALNKRARRGAARSSACSCMRGGCAFEHPASGETIELEAPLPAECAAFRRRLSAESWHDARAVST